MANPKDLMIRAEQKTEPFTYQGQPIIQIAHQINRRERNAKPEIQIFAVPKIDGGLAVYKQVNTMTTDDDLFQVLGLRHRTSTARGIQELSKDLLNKFINDDKTFLKLYNYELIEEGINRFKAISGIKTK